MLIFKKLKISEKEARNLESCLDGYIWVAIDARRGSIVAGDEYIADLRDNLLVRRSRPEDIYGVGLNLKTGAIDYIPSVNRRNPSLDQCGTVPCFLRHRIETLMYYFFESFDVFRGQRGALYASGKKIKIRSQESASATSLSR